MDIVGDPGTRCFQESGIAGVLVAVAAGSKRVGEDEGEVGCIGTLNEQEVAATPREPAANRMSASRR
jgi:hypothetical protein